MNHGPNVLRVRVQTLTDLFLGRRSSDGSCSIRGSVTSNLLALLIHPFPLFSPSIEKYSQRPYFVFGRGIRDSRSSRISIIRIVL